MNIAKKVLNNMLGTKKKAKDSDYDGVPDYKDCQPRNIMRQDKIWDRELFLRDHKYGPDRVNLTELRNASKGDLIVKARRLGIPYDVANDMNKDALLNLVRNLYLKRLQSFSEYKKYAE